METSVAETYHTQDEELRAYQAHLLSKKALDEAAAKQEARPFTADMAEPVFSD